MIAALQGDFRVGNWLVQPSLNTIGDGERSTRVKPRSMAVLACLAEAGGEVVGKHELMDAVWGQSVVTEDVLTQSIVELRKAFKDQANDPQIIETIRRVGFRLLPEVRPADEDPNAPSIGGVIRRANRFVLAGGLAVLLAIGLLLVYWPQWRLALLGSPPPAPSVAVLPFVNLSEQPGTDFFSDGLSEEVLNTLSTLPGLRVPARTSSFAFRGRDEDVRVIGESLNVTTLLEGSVRRKDQRVRVTAQLIDVQSGYHIWSQTYDRQLEDVFAVQSDIASAIAAALRVTLTGSDVHPVQHVGTTDSKAYELYLLGRHHMENELGDWIQDSRAAFQRAIAVDPQFARAYAGLADTYLVIRETPGSFLQDDAMPFDEAMAAAQMAIAQALELEPELADPYVSRATVAAARLDWKAEERDLRHAIRLNPALVRAHLRLGENFLSQGQADQAHAAFLEAARLDPLNPKLAASLAGLTAALGDYEAARSYPMRLIDSGLRSPLTLEALVNVNREYGKFVERVRWARELVQLAPTRASALAELADAYLELGELDLAEAWATRASELSATQAMKVRARLYGVRGDRVGMLRLVESAIRANPPQPDSNLSPAQSMVMALSGIAYLLNGSHEQSIMAFQRVSTEGATLHRRSPEMPLVIHNWLARSFIGAGMDDQAMATLASVGALAEGARQKGFDRYPPLVWELAVMHALAGRAQQALSVWEEAIALGWRDYYLDGNHLNPLRAVAENDPRYLASVRLLEQDLQAMREAVRNHGWAETPDAFFARHQITVSKTR